MVLMDTSLAALASSVPDVVSVDDATVTVSDVTHDSRQAGPGVIFVAIEGATADGHAFVESVVSAGSPAVLVGHRVDVDIPQIVVRDTRAAMAHLARTVHGSPDAAMRMVGITGTNGKTTVAAMCESILAAAGESVGVIGTLGTRIKGTPAPLERTTPESSDLFRLLATMRDADVATVVMEVSSHALALHRADAIVFDVVGFTNLSQDHLDFHGDMEAYYREKRKLFQADRARASVVNVSDEAGVRIRSESDVHTTTIGLDTEADYVARIIDQTEGSTRFEIAGAEGVTTCDLPLAGWFNVVNATVAFGICRQLGIDVDTIASGLAALPIVRGRMQLVDDASDIAVVVDYAHTPAAVETVVAAASDMTDGRIIAVLGAGGDRDIDKRPMMGAAAASHADVTVVTTDNPRSEPPETIAAAVERGALGVGRSEVVVVLDRRQAIAYAVDRARPGDLVLVLGKGHEPGQEVAGEKHPFDDISVAAEVLRDRKGAS